MRKIIRSNEFNDFFHSVPVGVQNKLLYALNIVQEVKVVNSKLVKKLIGSDFYELRISVGNEYRVILFTIDSESFIECKNVLLLNGFMKKSTKDYKKEIEKAERVLKAMQ